jgi:hypothetical protein
LSLVMVEAKLKYRGAEVIAADDSCDAARALTGVRLLSSDVPQLPLKTCDRPAACKCKYRHFDDRRRKFPRRVPHATPYRGVERRESLGRREGEDE